MTQAQASKRHYNRKLKDYTKAHLENRLNKILDYCNSTKQTLSTLDQQTPKDVKQYYLKMLQSQELKQQSARLDLTAKLIMLNEVKPEKPMLKIPAFYPSLTQKERRTVRNAYKKIQNNRCYFCKSSLDGKPALKQQQTVINKDLYPPNFFKHPLHLHHSHDDGLTLGTVHAKCNAILFEYYNE